VIAIVNYGLGNVQAFANIYKSLNIPCQIVSCPTDLRSADKIILPGVGAFDQAITRLNNSGLRDVLDDLVLVRKRPVLGICVGMQMMANRSEEGQLRGLGWIEGVVRKFTFEGTNQKLPIPHMGWNHVKPQLPGGLFTDIGDHGRFYFLHSYYFSPLLNACILSKTDYCGFFASGLRQTNVYGVQFHPEKSHSWGTSLLRNFARIDVC
jgi:imidazole glycerol-phosphate synthase subunit HisH